MQELLEWISVDGPKLQLAAARDDARVPDEQLLMVLSTEEKQRAGRFSDATERRHFVFRRCFQRLFVARVIGWTAPLQTLRLMHGLDQRPTCQDAPGITFSFSSSGSCYLFGASPNGLLGVDIEGRRHVENVEALARRFLSHEEAQAIAGCGEPERSQLFLTLWSAKEAGLKAKGRGIDSGLNTFTFENQAGYWHVRDHDQPESQVDWQLFLPLWREGHIVAVMHRPVI